MIRRRRECEVRRGITVRLRTLTVHFCRRDRPCHSSSPRCLSRDATATAASRHGRRRSWSRMGFSPCVRGEPSGIDPRNWKTVSRRDHCRLRASHRGRRGRSHDPNASSARRSCERDELSWCKQGGRSCKDQLVCHVGLGNGQLGEQLWDATCYMSSVKTSFVIPNW